MTPVADKPSEEPGAAGSKGSRPERPQAPTEKLSARQVAGSVLAAALGVQSRKNRERDFARGRPVHFVVAGVVFTALFVLAIVGVVRLVLSSVG